MQKLLLISLFLLLLGGCNQTQEINLNVTEPIPINLTNSVSLTNNGNIDAFGRIRVSEVSSLLDIKQLYDNDPLFIDEVRGGNGTSVYNSNEASSSLLTNTSGDYVIRQTKQVTNYQAGKSHQIFMTFHNFEPQTNIIKRVGYFSSGFTAPYNSSLDGLWLESSNNLISVNVAKSGVITQTTRSNWNLDKLDGTGSSGLTIDWNKSQILLIDFEWLGVGRVRWGVVVDGEVYYFHESNHANNIKSVYMTYPSQPLRWEVRQTGTGSGNFTHICSSVGTEGSINTLGVERSINTNGVPVSIISTSTKYVILGVRMQPSKHHSVIDILDFNLLSISNDNFYWEIVQNPTITGTLNWTNLSNSATQTTIGTGVQTLTGGVVIASGYGVQSVLVQREIDNALRIGTSINGTPDTYIIMTTPLTTNMNLHGSLTFREVR